MSAPPLAPELWNCGAVAVIVGLCAWSVRLLRLALRLLDARYAVHQEAVRYRSRSRSRLELMRTHLMPSAVYEDRAPARARPEVRSPSLFPPPPRPRVIVGLTRRSRSLSVLQNASMWHLQQLLRTKKEATAADMARVRVPFDVPASSIRLLRAAGERALALAVGVRCADSCAVQVLWNVRVDALERPHHRHHAVSTDCSDGHKMRVPQLPRGVFRRLGMGNSIRASPWVLSPVRRQTRRHRLNDDKVAESPNDLDTATLARFLVDPSAYSSQSCVETYASRHLINHLCSCATESNVLIAGGVSAGSRKGAATSSRPTSLPRPCSLRTRRRRRRSPRRRSATTPRTHWRLRATRQTRSRGMAP